MRISDHRSAPVDTALMVTLLQEWQRGTSDPAGSTHNPVKLVTVRRPTVAKPGSEAVGDDGFNSSPVEGGEVCSREALPPESAEWVESLLGFLHEGQNVC